MAGDPDPELRAWIATSSDLGSGVRQRLAEDSDPRVRSRVACGEWTPPSLMAHLVGDPHHTRGFVREQLRASGFCLLFWLLSPEILM